MASKIILGNRAKETSTTTGAGNITLAGAVTQFKAISSVVGVGNLFPYAIIGQTGSEWEVGFGTMLTSNTFQRTKVEESSNANQLVNFSAGTKDVFLTVPASSAGRIVSLGRSITAGAGYNLV